MSKINLHNYEVFLIDYLDGNLNEASISELKAFVLANPQLEIDLEGLDFPSIKKDDTKIDFKNDLKRSEDFVEDEELINYLENNLPEAERKAFELILLTNKDLTSKLEAYKKTILSRDPSVTFADKISLHKTEDELILNNSVLAYVEGQLSISDKLNFEKEIKNKQALQKELKLFQKTKFESDTTIVFEDKEALKKEAKVIALFSFRTVASIAAAILLLIGLAFVFNYYTSKPGQIKELAKTKTNNDVVKIENQAVTVIDSTDTPNQLIIDSKKFIAKNNDLNSKHQPIKKDSDDEFNKQNTDPLIVNKNERIDSLLHKDPNDDLKTVIANNTSAKDTIGETVANSNLNLPTYSKQNYLIAVEENDDEDVPSVPEKKGFWQRAVKVAKQVNKLGVRAIDGEETQGKNYSLSFNSFSVEKR